jgi:hypothetical protein
MRLPVIKNLTRKNIFSVLPLLGTIKHVLIVHCGIYNLVDLQRPTKASRIHLLSVRYYTVQQYITLRFTILGVSYADFVPQYP